jgi:hypothetical protein
MSEPVDDRRLSIEPRVIVGRRSRKCRVEHSLTAASYEDGNGIISREGCLAHGTAELPRHLMIEVGKDEASFLVKQRRE